MRERSSVRTRIAAWAPLLVAALAVIAFALCLQGCKYSDVLTEHVEDPDLGILDTSYDPSYKNAPNAPEDSTRMSSYKSNSDRIDDQKEVNPNYDSNATSNDTTDQREHKEDTSHEQNASTGDEKSDKDGKNTDSSTSDNKSEQGKGDDEGNGNGTTEETKKEDKGAGKGGEGKVFDATGSYTELPENVGQVAAAGSYATIVQMLAGQGGLAACDKSWSKKVQKLGLFPDEGVEDVPTVWTGSAEKGYKLDVDALIDAAPSAVLTDGVQVKLTNAQTKKIQAEGINIITVPTLDRADTADEYVLQAVQLVGELLKNSDKVMYSTQSSASMYKKMHDATIKACLDANGGYSAKMVNGSSYEKIYQDISGKGLGTETTNISSTMVSTVYFDSWSTDVKSSVKAVRSYSNAKSLYLDGETVDASDGVGLSATASNNGFCLIDYYMQISGVVNNAYDGMHPRASEKDESLPYLLAPGDVKDLAKSTLKSALRNAPSALWYSPTSASAGDGWLTVGDEEFPNILCKSTDIAKSVVKSAYKVNGLYNVGQKYEVRVVPSGVNGSWAYGTPESYLLGVWTMCVYQSAGDLETCDEYVNQFYETFYRVGADEGTSLVSNYDKSYTAKCPTE